MKKINIILLLTLCFSFIGYVNAKTEDEFYTNANGVSMNETQYNNLNTIYGDDYAKIVTKDKFNELLDIINSDISNTTKAYIKSEIHYSKYGEVIETKNTELSKEEYQNEISAPQYYSLCGMGKECWETNYKILNLSAIKKVSNTKFEIISTLTWKKMPSVRAGDIIGLWFPTFTKNTYSNNYSYIEYQKNGNTTTTYSNSYKTFDEIPEDDGDRWASYARIYGHELPSGNLTSLKIVQGVTLTDPTASNQHIISSYQHAVKSCSVNDSLNCVMNLSSATGIGSMYMLEKNCSGHFDEMQGVHLYIN